ncbi:unnamed protein product [Chrysoparadoxa australica]
MEEKDNDISTDITFHPSSPSGSHIGNHSVQFGFVGGSPSSPGRNRTYGEPRPDTMFYRNQGSQGDFMPVPQRPKLKDLLLGLKPVSPGGTTVSGSSGPPQRGYDLQNGDSAADLSLGEGSQEQLARLRSSSVGSVSGGPVVKKYEFGMWEGVFIRCLLNIFGVMMFLRLSWVVGESGAWLAQGVILLSVAVTTLTTVSLSAICTNGELKGGGAYYMISRSLGPEFGGSIGLAFYCANSISVALYLIGFAEAVAMLQSDYIFSKAWDERFFALLAMIAMAGIAFIGAAFEIAAQKVLLVVLLGALCSYLIGSFMADGGNVNVDGITGVEASSFVDNSMPDFSPGESFLTVFGVFFPAVTGIMAGANISGDLKDPQKAIPNGTFLAIIVSTLVYMLMACLLAATVLRETLQDFENSIVVVEISAWAPIVYAGIFAATLSSALAQIVGAPRILMALARDGIFPFLNRFGKGYGMRDEPVNALGLTLIISTIAILAGDLNSVSPLITNFFLVSYALVNYACFASSLGKSPGWRPSYKYYNLWVALAAAVLCFAVMLMVSLISAGITIVLCFLLYKYVETVKPDVSWGSAGEAYRYVQAINTLYRLESTKSHVKNFRPQYLVLCRDPSLKEHLVRFVGQLNQGRGALIVGNVVIGSFEEYVEEHDKDQHDRMLVESGVQGFREAVVAPTLLLGCEALLQLSGLGRLRPNTVVLGYKANWQEAADEAVEEYVNVIRASFGTRCAVGVLRGVDEVGKERISGGTVDVWWLVDDGGLTILIPHLLTLHNNWKNCKIRVFTVADKKTITTEQVRMNRLLRRFRIQAELVVVDMGLASFQPSPEEVQKFEKLSGEPVSTKDKTHYFLRLSRLLAKHSSKANMLVITLPVPRYSIAPRKYMAFLSLMSEGLPPVSQSESQ